VLNFSTSEGDVVMDDKVNLKSLEIFVKETIDNSIKASLDERGLTPEEIEKRKNKRARLEAAIQNCPFGNVQDKIFVKEFINDILVKNKNINSSNINQIIYFNREDYLSVQDKFEILLYLYKKKYGKRALAEIIKEHQLDSLKNNGSDFYYSITKEEIEDIYNKTDIELTFDDKMQIVIQRIYQNKFGYGCVDEILYMAVDGVSGGVSGIPENVAIDEINNNIDEFITKISDENIPRSYDSVWIFFSGKSINLEFLSFGSQSELERICQQIYSYDNPGNLSRATGYKVNELADGSRVVVLRPPFCESWAFFVRKFETPDKTLKGLIHGKNADMVIKLIEFLMKGCRTTAVTGAQGTGKTTLILAMIEHIYSVFNLRVLEMAFELHIRKRFPKRNVITVRETENVTGQEGLDVMKKTDGSVNIIGEVASHPVASFMIQSGQVASLFTVFSHHAKTFDMLIKSLRNSLLSTGQFTNETIAEEQVVEVINFDIHLENEYGKRYIERITECIPVDQEDYPEEFLKEHKLSKKIELFLLTILTFFKKSTDRRLYKARNIVEYNNGEFVVKNPISERNIKEMLKRMVEKDREEFLEFLEKYNLRERK
jgi:pilus assembly protein CpaF